MGYLDKRRSKLLPAATRAAQEEVRRQIALAVSITKRKTKAKVKAEVLESLQQVTGASDASASG
ncbi:hypothetical protein [Mesorhizobium wenxiniae]|uniref:Uncharacterized protein n=1 Tax=Mesorhizobium wenxiniae TaxID=2014805 RepID=A0A271KFC9_9HYPH|nr:hypothetical protein [Mesorhizobium wenxiniae]PAP94511.1 hypothetical protein CIT31_16055 [Mesorhizobium wenxiniae]